MHNLTDEDWKAKRLSVATWEANVAELPQQKIIKEVLARNANASFGPNCYIAPDCNFFTDSATLGRNVRIASQVTLRGNIQMGNNVSINPLTNVVGNVKIGDAVRIASSVQIFGFNHGFERVDKYIKDQPITSKGIDIGEGTWIGAGVSIVDGVKIGAHCVVAAGAVVTKSFPDFSIIGGTPAKVIKSRLAEGDLQVSIEEKSPKGNQLDYCVDKPVTGVLGQSNNSLGGWIASSRPIKSLFLRIEGKNVSIKTMKDRPDVASHLSVVRPKLAKVATVIGFETGTLTRNTELFVDFGSKSEHICTIELNKHRGKIT